MFINSGFFAGIPKVLLDSGLGNTVVGFIFLNKQSIRRLVIGKPVFRQYIQGFLERMVYLSMRDLDFLTCTVMFFLEISQ